MEELLAHNKDSASVAIMTVVRETGNLFVSLHVGLGLQNRHFCQQILGRMFLSVPFPSLSSPGRKNRSGRLTEETFLLALAPTHSLAHSPVLLQLSCFVNTPG